MKTFVRRLKRFALYTLLSVAALFGCLLGLVQVYQDEIVRMAVTELNKQLRAKVEVGQIKLSAFEKFPHLALTFTQLKVHGSLPERNAPLAVARKLYLTFDIWDLLGKDYVIDQVYLESADVHVFVNENGEENYNIFKKSTSTGNAAAEPVKFDLSNIQLQQVHVRYTDQGVNQEHDLLAEQVDARLVIKGADILINLEGDLQSRYIRIGQDHFFARKPLKVVSELQYDLDTRKLMIQPSRLRVHRSEFEVMGTYHDRPRPFVDLLINGKNTDVQTLLSLLPETISRQYVAYKSKGEVYFNGKVVGLASHGDYPKVDVNFGCRNASFFEEKLNKQITHANLKGIYSNGKGQALRTSSLQLRRISGRLDGKAFSGNFSLTNFEKPYLKFDLKGELDAASLVAFTPQAPVHHAAGTLLADIRFEGNMSDLQTKALHKFVHTSGTLGLRNVAFSLAARPLRFHRLNGNFSFSRSDLVIDDFTGQAGSSDFRLNGWFRNVLPYLLLDGQALEVVADFSARQLNLDELLASAPSSANATASAANKGNYRFVLSPKLVLDLTCQVDKVRFRRFRASQVKGDLEVKNGIARSRDIQLKAANGTMLLSAGVDGRQPDFMQVSCNAWFDNIAVDSVFYLFENFDQTFIQDRHIRGNVQARVQTYMVFNSRLDMDVSKLVADVHTKVADGQLNQFEPMQKLSGFIHQRELANLRFSEMENTVHIEKRKVFIPKMEIYSNVANISVEGTHSFDQVMDYHLRVPVVSLFQRKGIKSAAVVENGSQGRANFFLTIKGTSENYKIGYDTQAVRDKIREDMKKEKQEFREAFRHPGSQPNPSVRSGDTKARTTTQPAEEEYFDFNE